MQILFFLNHAQQLYNLSAYLQDFAFLRKAYEKQHVL